MENMFSGFLRKEREKRGISQERLCRGVCAVSALSRYENGEREPGIKELIRIADYFNVSLDYLLERSEQKR